ncbi:SKP1-like protein 9 [Lolium perenne]|uniref:SKP1-like protein 9 n=1 Tax=Lolium perenne TaxID=4522 RepID=UPI0021EAE28B|nr:SKP1-like protein 9 [Lolium perenne]
MAQEKEALFLLTFADGTEGSADARDAAAVLRGYAVPAPAIRSGRVFDMVVEYVEKHNAHRSGQAVDRDIDDWDRRFIARAAGDTDALHDLFLASEELLEYELMDLCAQTTADMIRGGTVEEIKTLLGIVGITPEQDLLAQHDHDRLLRIIR